MGPTRLVEMLLFYLGTVCLFLHFQTVSSLRYDATLVETAQGKDVTEAVLRHITSSNIFPDDHSFLARISYVETKFGKEDHTYRPEYYGGIWQVDEAKFLLSNHSSLMKLHLEIKQEFGIDWATLEWKNLVTPLYSGLAAALYLSFISMEHKVPIPDTISKQADMWRMFYRREGDLERFMRESRELREQTVCRGKMDLCIVLDSSGSINHKDARNYQKAKNFTAELIQSFTKDYSRIGLVIYSSGVEDIFPVKNDHSIETMAELARRAKYLNNNTRTDLGIQRAIEMFSDAGVVKGVPRLIFIFTDGNSNSQSDLGKAVRSMMENDITPVSVGIGDDIRTSELEFLALNNTNLVFRVDDFASLEDFLYRITTVACEAPQTVEDEGPIKDTVKREEKRYYEITVPPEGITVTLDVEEGKAKGYWSYSERVPSAAIYDGIIDSGTFYIPPPKEYARRRRKRSIVIEDVSEEGAYSNYTSMVFMTIEGVEEDNNYTLVVEIGNKAPNAEASWDFFSLNWVLVGITVISVIIIFSLLITITFKKCTNKLSATYT